MNIGDLFEGVVSRRGNILEVGSLKLTLYPDHIFYVVGGGKDADLSIYKDGAFKPPRNNEIYLKDAASRGVPQAFINLFSKFFATQDIDVVVNGLEALFKSHVKESTMTLEELEEAYSQYSGKHHSLHPLGSDKGDLLRKKGRKDKTLGQYTRDFTPFYAKRKLSKELGDLKKDIKANLGKHTKPNLPEEDIDEALLSPRVHEIFLKGLVGAILSGGLSLGIDYAKEKTADYDRQGLQAVYKSIDPREYPQLTKKLTPQDRKGLDAILGKLKEHAMRMEDLSEGNKENKAKKKAIIKPTMRPKDKMSDFDPRRDLKKKVAEDLKPLSVQQLATISDEALDKAYGYGRSTPGNTFGWQANLKSAEFAKRMIDKGITDIEKISDAIHQGWNVTAKAFVQNPNQFDDTAKLQAAGKLEAKLQQREKLMKIGYSQLPDDEKEKDRVVARALLAAITGEQGIAEGPRGMGVASRDWKQNKMSQASRRGDAGWSKPYRQPGEPSKADLSAMAAKAKADYDKKKGIREEEDHEASMARGQLMSACKNAMALIKMIQEGDNLEGWVAAKITKASDYLTMVHDYMAYEEVNEEKQRLDPKCWKGYRKAGTKMKGGVRVNNCVKVKK